MDPPTSDNIPKQPLTTRTPGEKQVRRLNLGFDLMQTPNQTYRYACNEGGPFVLLPQSVADRWEGADVGGDPLALTTDLGRACAIDDICGVISFEGSEILVIRHPPLLAWDELDCCCLFVLWAWHDEHTDGLIERAINGNRSVKSEFTWSLTEDLAVLMSAMDTADEPLDAVFDFAF